MTLDLTVDAPVLIADFGESIGFRLSDAGDTRGITGTVNRMPIEGDGAQPFDGHQSPRLHVLVKNHATEGVTPDEVVNDVSELNIGFPQGVTARWRKIIRVVNANAGAVLLEVNA